MLPKSERISYLSLSASYLALISIFDTFLLEEVSSDIFEVSSFISYFGFSVYDDGFVLLSSRGSYFLGTYSSSSLILLTFESISIGSSSNKFLLSDAKVL